MSLAVCLRCGTLKREGCWADCAVCGNSPRDDEDSLTRHFLASDNFYREAELKAMAARVQAGKPVEFPAQLLGEKWVNKAEVDERFREGAAIEQGKCPVCGNPIRYELDGLACGWECTACDWGIWTTNPDAVEDD
jgi:hypothetical protein